jgi:hypothetical protein
MTKPDEREIIRTKKNGRNTVKKENTNWRICEKKFLMLGLTLQKRKRAHYERFFTMFSVHRKATETNNRMLFFFLKKKD